jgi:hypothetical protein
MQEIFPSFSPNLLPSPNLPLLKIYLEEDEYKLLLYATNKINS